MSKCTQCRKYDAMDSWWDKIRMFFFRFFHQDIIDLSQDRYTQGFSDGYVKGREHQRTDAAEMERLMEEYAKKA